MLRHRRWLLLVGAVAAVAGMLVALASSSASTGRERAERAVIAKLRGHGHARAMHATCRTRKAGRWTCRWSVLRPRSRFRARRCRGTARATLVHSRVRVRLSRRWSCRIVAYDAATGPGAIVGFNDNAVRAGQISPNRDAAVTAAMGAHLQRVTFDWRVVEPRPGEYHFEEYDAIYKALRAHNIRPIWIPMFAPVWAAPQGRSCFFFRRDCRYPPSPRKDAAWRDILTRITKRYPAAAGIEIWNEPNLRLFWQPRPDPARYVQLLRSAWLAIKAADPGMPVIGGGLANLQQTGNGDISLPDFLSAVYSNSGQRWMDAIGVHAYPGSLSPDLFDTSMNEVRAVRNSYGDVGRPIWVTELGLTTSGPSSDGAVSEQDQARGLVQYLKALEAMPDVKAIVFHTLVSPRGWYNTSGPGYGVLRGDLTPKPAYCALGRALGANPPGC